MNQQNKVDRLGFDWQNLDEGPEFILFIPMITQLLTITTKEPVCKIETP